MSKQVASTCKKTLGERRMKQNERGFVASLETKNKQSSLKFKMSHLICHGVRDHEWQRVGELGDGSALRTRGLPGQGLCPAARSVMALQTW